MRLLAVVAMQALFFPASAADPAAIALGRKVYAESCAACHGADLKGVPGKHAPDLSDRAFLYGSDNVDLDPDQILASDIETTVRYGIRADHPKTRKLSFMPGYGGKDIDGLAEYLVTLRGKPGDAARAMRGKSQFAALGCADCHSRDAKGHPGIGATDLTSDKYLYGSDAASIATSIREGRQGTSPAFEGRLAPEQIKAVADYLFSVWEKAPK